MFGLKIYTVHIKPDDKSPYENPVFVQEGFNFYAFIFNFIWMIYNRLWLTGLLILLFNGMLNSMAINLGFHPMSIAAMQIGFDVLIGFHANDLKRRSLKKRGYITTDIVTGDSKMRAEQRFFERNADHILARA